MQNFPEVSVGGHAQFRWLGGLCICAFVYLYITNSGSCFSRSYAGARFYGWGIWEQSTTDFIGSVGCPRIWNHTLHIKSQILHKRKHYTMDRKRFDLLLYLFNFEFVSFLVELLPAQYHCTMVNHYIASQHHCQAICVFEQSCFCLIVCLCISRLLCFPFG